VLHNQVGQSLLVAKHPSLLLQQRLLALHPLLSPR
jgi:hypothetical protein